MIKLTENQQSFVLFFSRRVDDAVKDRQAAAQALQGADALLQTCQQARELFLACLLRDAGVNGNYRLTPDGTALVPSEPTGPTPIDSKPPAPPPAEN